MRASEFLSEEIVDEYRVTDRYDPNGYRLLGPRSRFKST